MAKLRSIPKPLPSSALIRRMSTAGSSCRSMPQMPWVSLMLPGPRPQTYQLTVWSVQGGHLDTVSSVCDSLGAMREKTQGTGAWVGRGVIYSILLKGTVRDSFGLGFFVWYVACSKSKYVSVKPVNGRLDGLAKTSFPNEVPGGCMCVCGCVCMNSSIGKRGILCFGSWFWYIAS